jgi:hypothetical protein
LEIGWEQNVKEQSRDILCFQTCVLEKTRYISHTENPTVYYILNCYLYGSCFVLFCHYWYLETSPRLFVWLVIWLYDLAHVLTEFYSWKPIEVHLIQPLLYR